MYNNRLQSVLKLGEQHLLFLKPIFNGKNDALLEYFKFGPFGELLCQNIRTEWLYSNVVSRDELVLPFSSTKDSDVICLTEELKEHYENARFLSGNKLPFSIVYTRQLKQRNNELNSNGPTESYYFRPQKHTQLKYIAFATPTDGQQFFYYWQRQRKIWWRKFSANPGRFTLAEIQVDDNKMEFTDIRAEFEWGVESIEVIKNVTHRWFESLSDDDRKHFEFQSGRKVILPHVIEATTSVEEAALIFLCDAFYHEVDTTRQSEGGYREVLKLHRKLAPYKTVFSTVNASNEKISEDLKMLAVYLTQELKKAGIYTLSSVPAQKSVEDEFLLHDTLGIPFTVVLNEATLSDGVLGIRSRETTLQETLHVSQLTDHLTKLMKRY